MGGRFRGGASAGSTAASLPRMRTRSEHALARPDNSQSAMVEAPTASGNAKPQSARAPRKKTLAAAVAEEGINDATQSSGKTEGGQGKRPARERNTGKGTREDAKRRRMDAAQGTAEKEVQTDPVAISAAAQPDISHYECPICISIIIAPVVCECPASLLLPHWPMYTHSIAQYCPLCAGKPGCAKTGYETRSRVNHQ